MKVAIVTGANRGLGLALVRNLCRTLGDDGVVYLCARDESRGESAVRGLEGEGLRPRLARVDVDDDASVDAFAQHVRREHGHVDIVISNAARPITPAIPQREQVAAFVETNNRGTHRMMRSFRGLLADGARYLVVASGLGQLRFLAPPVRDRFDVAKMRLEDIDGLMSELVSAVGDGTARAKGWGRWINVPSKIAQVASMKVFARDLREEAERRGILVAAVCPGLVDTDASRPWFTDMSKALSPDAAAVDVAWLATLPPEERAVYGELVQHRHVLAFAGTSTRTADELLDAIGIHGSD